MFLKTDRNRKILFLLHSSCYIDFLEFLDKFGQQYPLLLKIKNRLEEIEVLKIQNIPEINLHNLVLSIVIENNNIYAININRKDLNSFVFTLDFIQKQNRCANIFKRFKANAALMIEDFNSKIREKEIIDFLFHGKGKDELKIKINKKI